MSLQAKVIRHAVAAGLRGVDGLDSVHEARHRAVSATDLTAGPVVLVFTDSDRVVETRSLAPQVRRYVRELEVHVAVLLNTQGRNDPGADIADRLDEYGEEVERWFFARETNDPIWVEALLKRTESGPADESNKPVAAKILIFGVQYHDQAPKPSADIPSPLETVHVDHDLESSDGQVDAEDDITIHQA